MPRLLRSASRVILDWLPCVTGFLYVLLSLSRIIALYKGQRSGGQVPQPYGDHPNATWIVPDNMNDMNLEEPSRYVRIDDVCVCGGEGELVKCCYVNHVSDIVF